MRQVIEILRLKHEHHLSIREIARSCGLASSTVGDYLRRAEAAGWQWPLPEGVGEVELEAGLSALSPPRTAGTPPPPVPDWAHLHAELRRPNVTLRLLWQEYIRTDPSGLKYSRFCERYQEWRKTLEPPLRQVHVPGEKLFVDWAGQTVPIRNGADGTTQPASLFVAALGVSGQIFAKAFADQKLPSWISAHVHAYQFYGGVPALTVPDNTRTAVVQPCRYEPLLHRTYQEMAEHYGTVILPTRVRKPRDKAKAESAVQVAQRQILAALRDLVFFTVEELNRAIAPRLQELNAQPFQKLEGSRNQWFQTLDKPQLRPLPPSPFVVATWLEATVNIDYHVVVDHHYYSVPYGLIHQRLQVRLSESTVELFHKTKRVAAHRRTFQRGGFTTLDEHRPKSHQRYLEWTPSRIIDWAGKIGPQCALVVQSVMAARPHPEQGFRSCLGIIRLAKAHGEVRLEAACQRALHFSTLSYRSIESILDKRLETQPLQGDLRGSSPAHENVRGQEYFA
ncbi:MAG: IS21 family transposase [Limisphaerales bacterium]